jgi:PAS domain-containing protein
MEGEPRTTIGIFRDIRKRKRTENALQQAHEEIQNANRKLGQAYAQMREWKDRLSAQLGEAEIVFLVNKGGRILGGTEAALEFFGLNRIQMLRRSILDLAAPGHRRVLQVDLQRAWAGIPGRRSIIFERESKSNQQCDTKIMQVNLESVKMLLLLLRESS